MQNRFLLTPFFLDEAMPELKLLAKSDWRVNKPALPEGAKQHRMSIIHQALADFVAETAARGDRPVSIAGDCCTSIGMLAGLQRAGLNPVLIWFDAHGDFNTWETTPSGFLGGMPLAMLVGRGEQTMVNAVGLTPLSENQVILAGARDLDPGEQKLLRSTVVKHLADAKTLLKHSLPRAPLYIHFDTDIINPNQAPAMNYQAPGGPSATDLHDVFRYLAQTEQICAVSMSTWNPKLDQDGSSQEVCMALLYALIDNE
jgi:arginase